MAYDDRYPLKDYLNSINYTKDYLMEEDPDWEKNYPTYVINKCMSHHMDTIVFANEMNRYPNLDKRLQYDFYIHTVRPKRRFSPWAKKQQVKDLDLVKKYFYNHSIFSQGQDLSPFAFYPKEKISFGI